MSRDRQRMLLVEGKDDEQLVIHLCSESKIGIDFEIKIAEGYPEILRQARTAIKDSEIQCLGLVLDADDGVKRKWRELAHQLEQVGINELPNLPEREGCVVEGEIKLGIWIMPDNESEGEIEDYFVSLIPERDVVWPLAKRYIDELPEEGRKFNPSKLAKAQVHAWLATRKNPGKMGAAVGAGDLDTDKILSSEFVRWLKELYI